MPKPSMESHFDMAILLLYATTRLCYNKLLPEHLFHFVCRENGSVTIICLFIFSPRAIRGTLTHMPKPYVLTISTNKGGAGKTTTAVHLAAGLALDGRRVLLVDL